MFNQEKIRNVAIIAHVDHGKTTLVDQLFKQSGMFRSNQVVAERLMDSMDLERERGITIKSKNGACHYKDYLINIIDTPGHADFGGEVERVLNMADGAIFLVDAAEGPMPQSYFVLKKAIARDLPVIVLVNKIDKSAARCDWVVDQVFDLMVKLNAPDHILDFPVLFASAREGFASHSYTEKTDSLTPLFDAIIKKVPAPSGDLNGPLQLLVSTLSYSTFLGRLAVGKVTSGQLKPNQMVALYANDTLKGTARITKIFHFDCDKQIETPDATTGDIVAVSGLEAVRVGDTITDSQNPIPLKGIAVDPPTVAMTFLANTSPFSGQEGEYVTSNHLKDRLHREMLTDVAMMVEDLPGEAGFKVSGRGELHLAIFIEKIRREGYEFQVSRPTVIFKEENGQKMEPYEEVTIDVSEDYMGKVIESLGTRKGQLLDMSQHSGMVRLKYKIPTRGLLGYRADFMTETKGMGVFNYVFYGYGPFVGDIRMRKNGVMISKDQCTTVAYALANLQERGRLFLGAGIPVYEGQIIGEHAREDDLVVNPGKAKKQSNVRASGTDDAISLTPHVQLSLEQYLAYISDNELVEVTPKSIRLRKV